MGGGDALGKNRTMGLPVKSLNAAALNVYIRGSESFDLAPSAVPGNGSGL